MIDFSFDAMVRLMWRRVGYNWVRQARLNLEKISYGRRYPRPNGKFHIASKVGESPNNDSLYSKWKNPNRKKTPSLSQTIRFEVRGREIIFGAGNRQVQYAKFLEPRRPFLMVSVSQQEERTKKIMKEVLKSNMRARRV